MNFKKLLLFLVAPLMLAFAGCEPTPEVQTFAECSVVDAEGNAVTTMAFGAELESATFTVTATRSWTITTSEEWIAVSPKDFVNADNSSQKKEITVSVFANEGEARTATLSIDYGDTKPLTITVSQSGKGQTVLGEEIYYDNFDKGTAQDNSGWPALDGFVNPTGTAAEGVTYTVANVQARSNSPSNNSHSGYMDEASGGNNAFYRTNGVLTINNIDLSAQTSKDYTLTFGCYRSVYGEQDNSFKASEFHVFLSGDGQKWTEITYQRPADEVSSYGTWNKATASFTLKEKPAKLSIRFASDLVSSHRLDDVKLTVGGGGAEIDLANGTTSGGGNTEPEQPSTPGTISAITKAGNYTVEGVTVLASYARGYLVGDSTGKILAYLGQSHTYNFAVGDVVTVSGAVSSYGGLLQFGEGTTLTKTGTATVDHGTAKNYDGAAMDAYLNSIKIEYVTYTGTLNISGYYYNITVPGANTAIGSIAYPAEGLVDSALNGQNVTVTGYTVGASSGKYVNTMAISVVAAGGDPIVPEPEPEPTPEVEIPEGAVVWTIGASNQTWAADTDATLGAGFAATVNNLKVGYYTHKSSNAVVAARDNHIRVYKNSALVITPLDGRKITKVIMLCSDPYSTSIYTWNMNVSDGTTATANQEGQYITWSGNTDKFEAYADNGQVRIETLAVVLEGEGGGTVTPDPTPDPEPDPEPEPTPGDFATIASVLALGQNATVAAGTTIEGIVISNMALNNLTSKKGMYVQDATGALQFYLAANHEFAFGDKVQIDLGGAQVGAYNGAVQISGLALDKITKVSSGNTVEAKTVSIADFLANKYEGQYVAIEGVQVVDADLTKTWVMGGAHTSINMEDANGNKFVVFSSKYATYGAATVAQGSGTIKGISSINNGSMQIIFAQDSDYAGLTGARLGGGTVTPEPEPEPEVGVTKTYVKVTSAPADWTGEYLIVYEEGSVAFDSSLEKLDAASNNVAVTIADGKITTDSKYAFTVVAVEGGYSLKASNGQHIGASSYANSLKTDKEYVNTLSIDADGNAVIGVVLSDGTVTMRYNYAKDQLRFRYYKSGQQPVALYKAE